MLAYFEEDSHQVVNAKQLDDLTTVKVIYCRRRRQHAIICNCLPCDKLYYYRRDFFTRNHTRAKEVAGLN